MRRAGSAPPPVPSIPFPAASPVPTPSADPSRPRACHAPLPEPLGVGFIGAGDIAILHAAAVKKCPGAKLVGLWNRSQDRAEAAGRRVRLQELRRPPEALVADPAIDAVFVLTNLETHLEYTKLRPRTPASTSWSRSRSACRSPRSSR